MKANAQFLLGKWLPLFAALALLSPCRVSAINLLVYNKNLTGAGSLPQAISDNAALGGGNTIIFSNIVTGTMILTTGELLITKDVTILGPGANVLAITGNASSRVFHFTNVTAKVSGLEIANGMATSSSGGGIFNDDSSLTVSNCNIVGNTAGNYGGGIYNRSKGHHAQLVVTRCTFLNNSASSGGGIYNDGYSAPYSAFLSVINSTFSDNSAGGHGGGITCYSGYNSPASATVEGCTFSGNSGTSAGGIYLSDSSLTIGDTILKAGASGANIFNDGGTVTSSGYNLCSDAGVTNRGGTGNLTAVGDQLNTDPLLGPLQNNGGPLPTHMPLAGSPAIDQGKNLAGTATDQRGRARIFDNPAIPNAAIGDGSDIGAVEAYPASSMVVSNTSDNGTGSLRQALVDAAPGDAVAFAPDVTGTITLTSGELLIYKSIPIIGPGAKILAINGNAASCVFHTVGGVTSSISGLTITNGNPAGGIGGGICNSGSTLTVSNCLISGNSATTGGGGIYNDGYGSPARLSVIASAFIGNSGAYGGGIDNVGTSGSATLTVSNSTFANNSASTDGGAIFSTGQSGGSASLAVIGCTFASNSASFGGGIRNGINSMLTIGDTILMTGALGANLSNSSGNFFSLGYNLSSDNGAGYFANATDQINTDPKLAPLADYGGPTPTMALLSNSPAIDKGKRFGLATDQRGAPRPYDFAAAANAIGGDGSDIGAFEVGSPQLIIQRAGTNAVLSWPSYYGDFSLQSSTNIALHNAWVTAAGNAKVVGNQYQQTNGPISGNRSFRLKQSHS